MGDVFDIGATPVQDRIDVIHSLLDSVYLSDLRLESPAESLIFRMEVDALGPVTVNRATSNGMQFSYSSVDDAPEATAAVSLAIFDGPGTSVMRQYGRETRYGPGDAILIDLTQAYEFGWSDFAQSNSIVVSLDYASITPGDVRRALAGPALQTSLGALVKNHTAYVMKNIDSISQSEEGRAAVAQTTSDLMRALISQGLDHGPAQRDAWSETEMSRILAFVGQNLRDRDLTPSSIAAAHFISERHLYRLSERAGLRMSEWIMSRRLEAARADLADISKSMSSVESIAHYWGFRSAAHFSRRFKTEYGYSPSEWRRVSTAARVGAHDRTSQAT